jgi:hypothetical protein
VFIMMTIMNLFSHLMKSYLFNNHGNLQPQVTIYPEPVHLHQLQHLLVFKTNHHIPTFIWYPLILEMERLHLFNRLEQLHHVNQRPSNQSVSIPHIRLVEPKATPTIVRQGVYLSTRHLVSKISTWSM